MQVIELIFDAIILVGLIVCVVMMRASYHRAQQIFTRLDALEAEKKQAGDALPDQCAGCGDRFEEYMPVIYDDEGGFWHEECWDDMRGSR